MVYQVPHGIVIPVAYFLRRYKNGGMENVIAGMIVQENVPECPDNNIPVILFPFWKTCPQTTLFGRQLGMKIITELHKLRMQ
jgi:hypothetical protein